IALVNGGLFELAAARVEHRPIAPRRVLVPLAAFATCLAYGLVRIPLVDELSKASPALKVALVQTNLGARDKHEHVATFIRRHIEMTREIEAQRKDIDLVVWPESAYNAYIPKDAGNVRDAVLPGLRSPVLFGALTNDLGPAGERRHYNSAV